MTGDEHYRKAEKMVDIKPEEVLHATDVAMASIAAAQVHATLALAAATFEAAFVDREHMSMATWIALRDGWGYGR